MRSLARDAGLPVADKRESQDLCFLAGSGRRAFMRRHGGRRLAASPGEIVDRSGRVLGRHDGHHDFTVGQRRGLGVGGGDALYVLEGHRAQPGGGRDRVGARRPPRARGRADAAPASRACRCSRLRYRSEPLPCRAVERDGGVELELERPARAVAPGQVACLLDGDLVVGCGTIQP